MVRRHLRVGRHFRSLSDDSDHATRSVRVDKKLGWRSSPRALSMIRKTMLETVPARASSPGCSARMIKFASPPSEVMLEAPGVRREPLFKGVMRFNADYPGRSGMAPAGFTAFTASRGRALATRRA